LDTALNKKILIVDDEEDILELVSYNLEQNGFQTETAVTGEAGLKVPGPAARI